MKTGENKNTKKYLLAKLKLAQTENESLKQEVLDSDTEIVRLIEVNNTMVSEKKMDNEFKKDYIDSYKHIRDMQKLKFEMKIVEKETIAAILPIGLQMLVDLTKNTMSETKVEINAKPCPIKPTSKNEKNMFSDLKPTPRP